MEKLITDENLIILVNKVKENYRIVTPNAIKILAKNINNSNNNKIFYSIRELAKELKGDRQTISNYIKGIRKGLYRKEWKFYIIKK